MSECEDTPLTLVAQWVAVFLTSRKYFSASIPAKRETSPFFVETKQNIPPGEGPPRMVQCDRRSAPPEEYDPTGLSRDLLHAQWNAAVPTVSVVVRSLTPENKQQPDNWYSDVLQLQTFLHREYYDIYGE